MLRTYLALAVLAAGCAGCAGCKSEPANAAEQCHAMIASFCRQNADCPVKLGVLQASAPKEQADALTGCHAAWDAKLDCSTASADQFNWLRRCTSDVEQTPCASWSQKSGLPIPASCAHFLNWNATPLNGDR